MPIPSSNPSRRQELRAQYEQSRPQAGVYRIVNARTNRFFLASTPNLAGVRNKMDFARSTNTPGFLDRRLREDAQQFGVDAFSLEVLEVLDVTPEMSPAQVEADLAALEQLWRERLDPALLY